MGADPGGGGDPHMIRFDGHVFDFVGNDKQRYNLLANLDGKLRANVRVEHRGPAEPGGPPVSFFRGLDLHAGACHVFIDVESVLHLFTEGFHLTARLKVCSLDAPGHGGCTTDDPHPLRGVPHLNIAVPQRPESAHCSGLMVDGGGEGDDCARHEIPG